MTMPSRPKLADPGTLIRNGKLRTDEYRVCLDPDLVTEYERLVKRRDLAKEASRDSLAGGAAVELDEQIAAKLEEMEASTVTLVLQAMPRPKFRRLVDAHPQRKDAEGKLTHSQDLIGFNYDAFFDAAIRASLISPDLDDETLTVLLEERLTDKQYMDLTDVVWDLNKTTVSVPFSSAVSPSRRNSSRK